jgi:cell wall-active antibiotic response 4TMS protein YvqF
VSTTPSTTPPTTSTRQHRRGGLAGPVLLIVLGLVFLLPEFYPWWSFRKTWPVLLVAVGVAKLIDATLPPRPPEGPRV